MSIMRNHEKAFLLLKGCNCENCTSYMYEPTFEQSEGFSFIMTIKTGCRNKARMKLQKPHGELAPLSLTGICDYYEEKAISPEE